MEDENVTFEWQKCQKPKVTIGNIKIENLEYL